LIYKDVKRAPFVHSEASNCIVEFYGTENHSLVVPEMNRKIAGKISNYVKQKQSSASAILVCAAGVKLWGYQ